MFMVLRTGAFVYRVCYLRIKEGILLHPLLINLLVAIAEVNQLVSQVNWIYSSMNLHVINITGKHSEFTHYKCNLYKGHSPGEAVYAAPVVDFFLKHSSFGTWCHCTFLSSSMFFFSSRCPVLYLLQLNPPTHLLSCVPHMFFCLTETTRRMSFLSV